MSSQKQIGLALYCCQDYTTAVRDAYFGLLLIAFLSITSASELSAQNASTATPPPVASRIASPGGYYLTQWASVKTHDSIRGYPPGTHVTLVEDRGEHLAVRIGDLQFDVKPDQVTNDFEIVMRAWETYRARQQQLAAQAAVAQQQPAAQEQQRQIAQAFERKQQQEAAAQQQAETERQAALQRQAELELHAQMRAQIEEMAAKEEIEDLQSGQAIISNQASQAQGMAQHAQQQIQQMQMDASVREGEEIK